MPRIRFEKLDALAADTQGPGKLLWNMESAFLVRDDIWDKMYTAFEAYSAEHSSSLRTPQHSNLGLTLIVPDPDGGADLKLGRWLKKQRQHRHDGGMKPDREARLQKLVDANKFKWSSPPTCIQDSHRDPKEDDRRWNYNFELLKAFGVSQVRVIVCVCMRVRVRVTCIGKY